MEVDQTIIEATIATYREELGEALAAMRKADSPQGFVEAERALHQLTKKFAATMTESVLQKMSDDKTCRKKAAERVKDKAATRGIKMRSERRRETDIRTLGGAMIRVTTPYMTARPQGGGTRDKRGSQGTGVYPVLDMLGIQSRSTPALRLHVALAVAESSSTTAAREVLSSEGTDIDHKAALRLTYDVTEDALRARERAIKETTEGNDEGEFIGKRVVVSVDGGRLRVRRRTQGRPRKGGRKHFVTEWREPRVLTIYTVDEEGQRDKEVSSVIDATLGDADATFRLLIYHLRRLGVHQAEHVSFVADGAPWIWVRTEGVREALGLASARFTEFIDWYHVVERLHGLSQVPSGWSEERRTAWVAEQKERLMEGQEGAVKKASLELLEEGSKAYVAENAFWSRNANRMRYDLARQVQLPIGSGAVESAVRRVVNLRLKGPTIHWLEEHAEGILHLRSYAKAGRWKEIEQAVLSETGWRPKARRVPKAA